MCPVCNRPASRCTCKSDKLKASAKGRNDGVLRIKHEVKGRKGKAVTTISGFEESDGAIKSLLSELKSCCGTGGSVKDGVIIIQGDHRATLKALLEQKGFRAKLSGG